MVVVYADADTVTVFPLAMQPKQARMIVAAHNDDIAQLESEHHLETPA
jgi:hypothetical protein